MDSSPDTTKGGEEDAEVMLRSRNLTQKGQFSIPDNKLFGLDVSHKDLGVFEIEGIPFTKPIYETKGGIRSTVESGVRKALDIEDSSGVDIKLIRIIPVED